MSDPEWAENPHRNKGRRRRARPSTSFQNPYETPAYDVESSPRPSAHKRAERRRHWARSRNGHAGNSAPTTPQNGHHSDKDLRLPSPYRRGSPQAIGRHGETTHRPSSLRNDNQRRPKTTGTGLRSSSHRNNGTMNGNGSASERDTDDDRGGHVYSVYGELPEDHPHKQRVLRERLHRSLKTEQALRSKIGELEQENRTLKNDTRRLNTLQSSKEKQDVTALKAKLHDARLALDAADHRELILQRELKAERAGRANDQRQAKEKSQQRISELQKRLDAKTALVSQLKAELQEQEVGIRELQHIIAAKNARLAKAEEAAQKAGAAKGSNRNTESRQRPLPVYESGSEEDEPPDQQRQQSGDRDKRETNRGTGSDSRQGPSSTSQRQSSSTASSDNTSSPARSNEDASKNTSLSASGNTQALPKKSSPLARSSTTFRDAQAEQEREEEQARDTASGQGEGDGKDQPRSVRFANSEQGSASSGNNERSQSRDSPRRSGSGRQPVLQRNSSGTSTSARSSPASRRNGSSESPAQSPRAKRVAEKEKESAAKASSKDTNTGTSGGGDGTVKRSSSTTSSQKASPATTPRSSRTTHDTASQRTPASSSENKSPKASRRAGSSTPGNRTSTAKGKEPATTSSKGGKAAARSKGSAKKGTPSGKAGASGPPAAAAAGSPKPDSQEYSENEIAAIVIQSAYRGWVTRKTFEQLSTAPTHPALAFSYTFHQSYLERQAKIGTAFESEAVQEDLARFVSLDDGLWERDPVISGATTPEDAKYSKQILLVTGSDACGHRAHVASYVHSLVTKVPAPRRLITLYHSIGADPMSHQGARWTLQRICAMLVYELQSDKTIPRDTDSLRGFLLQILRAASMSTRVLLVIDSCEQLDHEDLVNDLLPESGLPDNVKVILTYSETNGGRAIESLRTARPRPRELDIEPLSSEAALDALSALNLSADVAAAVKSSRDIGIPLYLSTLQSLYENTTDESSPATVPSDLSSAVSEVLATRPFCRDVVRAIAYARSPLPLASVLNTVQAAAPDETLPASWTVPKEWQTSHGGLLVVHDYGETGGVWVSLPYPELLDLVPISRKTDIARPLSAWALDLFPTEDKKGAYRNWLATNPGAVVALRELPRFITDSGGDLSVLLNDIGYILRRCAVGTATEFARDLHSAGGAAESPEMLAIVESNTYLLEESPHSLIQDAANLGSGSELCVQAKSLLQTRYDMFSWLELAFTSTSRKLRMTSCGMASDSASFVLFGLINENGKTVARAELSDLSQSPTELAIQPHKATVDFTAVAAMPSPSSRDGPTFIACGTQDGRVVLFNQDEQCMIESITLPRGHDVTALANCGEFLFACNSAGIHVLSIRRAEWQVTDSLATTQHTRRTQGVLGTVLTALPMRIELLSGDGEDEISCVGLAYAVATAPENQIELLQVQYSGDDRWSLVRMSVSPSLAAPSSQRDTYALSDTAGQFALVTGKGSQVNVWNTKVQHTLFGQGETWEDMPRLNAPEGVSSIAWISRNRLATGGNDGQIRVWNCLVGRALHAISTKHSVIRSLLSLPNGHLAAGGSGTIVTFHDTSPPARTLKKEDSGDICGVKRIHRLSERRLSLHSIQSDSPEARRRTSESELHGVDFIVPSVSFRGGDDGSDGGSSQGSRNKFISLSSDRELVCYAGDQLESRFVLELEQHLQDTQLVSVSPDGDMFLLCSSDGSVNIGSIDSIPHEIGSHSERITSAVFSPNGKLALTSSLDRQVCVYDVLGACPWRVHRSEHPVLHAAFSPDSSIVAFVSGFDNGLAILDLDSGAIRRPKESPSPTKVRTDRADVATLAQMRLRRLGVLPTQVAFLSPVTGGAGSLLVGYRSGQIVAFTETTLDRQNSWQAHSAAITGLFVFKDIVVTSGRDSLIKVWRISMPGEGNTIDAQEVSSVHCGAPVSTMTVTVPTAPATKSKAGQRPSAATVAVTLHNEQSRVYHIHIPDADREGRGDDMQSALPPAAPARLVTELSGLAS